MAHSLHSTKAYDALFKLNSKRLIHECPMRTNRSLRCLKMAPILGTIVGVSIIVLLFRSRETEISLLTLETASSEKPAQRRFSIPTARQVMKTLSDQAELDEAITLVDPDRAMDPTDREYRIGFERHRAIKTWRAAPCAKHPDFDGVLITLLENGYGIKEWPEAIRAITSWSEVEFHNANQLRQLGVGEEDIPREVERYRNENLGEWKRCRAMLKASTGITDDKLLDELMNIPLHWPFFNDPLNTANVVNHRGEAFLSDSDWMEPRHVEALERYSGEARKRLTALEITELYADEVMLVNEYEAILDRENVHPALSDYRDDDYYENKRRLNELGHQKVEMLQSRQE